MNKDARVVGLDVDGVLAQFNEAFKLVQIETSGRDLFPPNWSDEQISCWNWPTDQYGYSKEEYKAAWEVVWASTNFWNKLWPYAGVADFLRQVRGLSDNIYYITQRRGVVVKAQTENWLRRYGAGDNPTVLISADKPTCCQAVRITHYLDDKDENFDDMPPATSCYMMARGWNHERSDVPRIKRLEEFLEGVRNG